MVGRVRDCTKDELVDDTSRHPLIQQVLNEALLRRFQEWVDSLPKPPEAIRVILRSRDGLESQRTIPWKLLHVGYRLPCAPAWHELASWSDDSKLPPGPHHESREYRHWGRYRESDIGPPVPIMEEE